MRFFIAIAIFLVSAYAERQPEFKSEAEKGLPSHDSMYKHGLTLECDFGVVRHYWGEMYTCIARNFRSRHYYDYIVNATGDHLTGKTDADVEAVYFLGQDMKFLPYNISTPFRGLRAVRVEDSGLRYLNRTLAYEGPLEYLHLERNELREVPVWAFTGLTTLKWLSFRNNHIRYLESSMLREMTNLRRFSVSNNHIEVVPSGMFHYNRELEEVYFYNNKIRMIGERLFETLPKLKVAVFMGNVCTNVSVYDGTNIRTVMRTEFSGKCSIDCRRSEKAAKETVDDLKEEMMNLNACAERQNEIKRQGEYKARHPGHPGKSSESDED